MREEGINMDWLKRMNTVLDYIEENLDGDIKDSKIAALFANTRGMFQRVFAIITEMTLAEYIRKRRLTQAALDIQKTDAKIIEIAVKYGYNSAKAFSSAFKSFHGITPSDARTPGAQFQSFSRFTFSLTLTIIGGNDMQYRTIKNAEDILQKISTALEASLDFDAANTFTYPQTFREGLAVIKKDGKIGFVDKRGSIVIPCIYDEPANISLGGFHEG
jgi:AraC family transcriptional regulator